MYAGEASRQANDTEFKCQTKEVKTYICHQSNFQHKSPFGWWTNCYSRLYDMSKHAKNHRDTSNTPALNILNQTTFVLDLLDFSLHNWLMMLASLFHYCQFYLLKTIFSHTLRIFHVLLMDIQYLKCTLKCQKFIWLLQFRMAQICEVNENWQTVFFRPVL